jgi:hypothetical protein
LISKSPAPGEVEPGADQELAAVGGDDLVARPLELDATQVVPGRVVGARLGRLGQGRQQLRRAGRPGRRQLGHLAGAVERGDVILARLRDAPVRPADGGPAWGRGFEDDRRIGRALEVSQGVERDGDGRRRPVAARLDVGDGQVAIPILRP